MASSKLLKEAIADAKAVRETAIANAKIALEEAFTPRLQSILSKKLQAEMEGEEEEADINEDNDVSSEIGGGDNKMPATKANDDDTDLSGIANQSAQVGAEVEDYDKVKEAFLRNSDLPDEYLDVKPELRGYGGACLPKDVLAMNNACKKLGIPNKLFEYIDKENKLFKKTVFEGMRK